MNRVSKSKTLRKASLIALITGGLVAGGIVYTKNAHNTNPDKIEDKEMAKNYQDLSTDKIEQHINECNIALDKLKEVIDSEETNPEERFEARRAYNSILKQRDEMKKMLSKRQKSMLHFNAGHVER